MQGVYSGHNGKDLKGTTTIHGRCFSTFLEDPSFLLKGVSNFWSNKKESMAFPAEIYLFKKIREPVKTTRFQDASNLGSCFFGYPRLLYFPYTTLMDGNPLTVIHPGPSRLLEERDRLEKDSFAVSV